MASQKTPKGAYVPRCVDCGKKSDLLQCESCRNKAERFRIYYPPSEDRYKSDRRRNGNAYEIKPLQGN